MEKTAIALITYNRPDHTKRVLDALRRDGAQNIFIFSDAPRSDADHDAVQATRRLFNTVDWTRPEIIVRDHNLGLARSIVSAADHVFADHDRMILLEDDCVPQPYFLNYMHSVFDRYADVPQVFGISGYGVDLGASTRRAYAHDIYFYPRVGTWGWGTWRRAWQRYERNLAEASERAQSLGIDLTQGGKDIPAMLQDLIAGRINDVWSLNWMLTMFINRGVFVYPTRSHIDNIGMDGSGVHCGQTDRFTTTFARSAPTRLPDDVDIDLDIARSFRRYYDLKTPSQTKPVRMQGAGLKVVHVNALDNGGAGKAAFRLHQAMCSRGIDSTMLVMEKSVDAPSVKVMPSARSNCPVIEAAQLSDTPSIFRREWERWRDTLRNDPGRAVGQEVFSLLPEFSALGHTKEFLDADIVHFHWTAGMIDYSQLPQRLYGRPVVWTLHDMNPFTGGCHYAGTCRQYRKKCRTCPQLGLQDHHNLALTGWTSKRQALDAVNLQVVSPSKWLGREAEKSAIMGNHPVKIIPNGVPTDIFMPQPAQAIKVQLGIPSASRVVLFGADSTQNTRKGFSFLLEALTLLDRSRFTPENLHVLVFGQMDAATSEQLPFPLAAVGAITDEAYLADIYSVADTFVIPSIEDNLPNTVIESLSCGTPVVGFRVGGIPDMVIHRETGYLSAPGDAAELARGITWILDHSDRSDLRRRCREHVLANFQIDRQALAYTDIYQEMISRNESTRQARQATIEKVIASSQRKIEGGDLTSARNELVEALSIDPGHAAVYNQLGVVFFQESSSSKALEYYSAAHRLEPQNPVYSKNLADLLYFANQDVESALQIYLGLLERNPQDVETLYALARISQAHQQLDEARLFFERILSIDPGNAAVRDELKQLDRTSGSLPPCPSPADTSTPVLVYQMGKVGSTTVKASLDHHGVPNQQIHFLSETGISQTEDYYRRMEKPIPAHLQRSRATHQRVVSESPTAAWQIITLVRDPVARMISSVFQNLDTAIPNHESLSSEDLTRIIQSLLIEQFEAFDEETDYICTWFDREIKTVFELDVFELPFHHHQGYTCYFKEKLTLLLIRLEDLSVCAPRAFAEFLNISDFTITNRNVGHNKDYQQVYRRVLEKIRIPRHILEGIYASRFARHFYTSKERQEFMRRWLDPEHTESHGRRRSPAPKAARPSQNLGTTSSPVVEIPQRYPRISIVTPSFNQAAFLESCILSILEQGYPNLEYIIMDGGSTDGSVSIIKKYAAALSYWQSQPDGGQYSAINSGFKLATGDILAWLNSDDMLHAKALFKVAALFDSHPQIDWILGRSTVWDADSDLVKVENKLKRWDYNLILNGDFRWIQQESTFWRRSLWEHAGGGIDTRFELAGDFELWCRFFRQTPLYRVDALLGGYRHHGNQRAQIYQSQYLREVEAIIERERQVFGQARDRALVKAPFPLGIDSQVWREFMSGGTGPEHRRQSTMDASPPLSPEIAQGYEKAQRLISEGRFDQAQMALEKLVQQHKGFSLGHNDLGVLNYRAGRKEQALACYEEAVRQSPSDTCLLKNLADFYYYESGRPEAAVKLYTQVMKADTEDCEARLSLANIHLAMNDLPEARRLCLEVHALDPSNNVAHELLVRTLDRLKSPSRCLETHKDLSHEAMPPSDADEQSTTRQMEGFLEILNNNPRDTEALNGIGIISAELGKMDDAKGFFRTVLEIDPHNQVACSHLDKIRSAEKKELETPTLPAEDKAASRYARASATDDHGAASSIVILPRVTIVTPNLNQGAFLEKCIRSVLAQEYPKLEYWIIDGGSTDESLGIIEQYANHLTGWLSEPDEGQSNAINKGLAHATGHVFAWLNADDFLEPGALDRMVAAYRDNPTAAAWVGACRRLDPDGKCLNIVFPNSLTRANLGQNYNGRQFYQPACFFNTNYLRELGGLDENLHYAMDFDLYLRLMAKAPFVVAPGIWANALIHPGAKTQHARKKMFAEIHQVQKREGFLEGAEQTYDKIHFSSQPRFIVPGNGSLNPYPPEDDREINAPDSPPRCDRRGLCFIGHLSSLQDQEDLGAFLRSIFPLIQSHHPDLGLHIYATSVANLRPDFETDQVRFLEYPKDMAGILAQHLVLVHPLTDSGTESLAAAAEHGLPIVTTPDAVSALPLRDGLQAFIAADPVSFAYKCLQLVDDRVTWENFRLNATKAVREVNIGQAEGFDYSEGASPRIVLHQSFDHRLPGAQGDEISPPALTNSQEKQAFENYTQLRAALETMPSDASVAVLEDYLAQHPNDAKAYNDMGVLALRAGHTAKVLTSYQRAVELAPEETTFRKNLADFLYVELGRIEAALSNYHEVLKQEPTDVETLLALGHLCQDHGSPRDAEDFFRQVLMIAPENQTARAGLGITLPQEGHGISGRVAKPRMVFISQHLPRHDRGSADYRNFQILVHLIQEGWEILYLYRSEVEDADRYIAAFQEGMTFRQLPWKPTVYQGHIDAFKPTVVWISSLWTLPYAEFVASLVQKLDNPKPYRLLLDTMDFHAKKYARKFTVSKSLNDQEKAERFEAIEASIYPKADTVITVTAREAEDIKTAIPQIAALSVIPNIHPLPSELPPLEGRRHICFLGNFTVNHNVDAAKHFVSEILPRIRKQRPDTEFHLIGFASDKMKEFQNLEGVRLIGPVMELDAILSHYRVFACPMTYGAGMKGKIGMAMAHGLPVVSTSIGMEGFPVTNFKECCVADEIDEFSASCLTLMEDDNLWRHLQANAHQMVADHFSRHKLAQQLCDLLGGRPESIPAPKAENVVKPSDNLPLSYELAVADEVLLKEQLASIHESSYLRCGAQKLFGSQDLHISWVLTRRCNYDCSYCTAHDNQDKDFSSWMTVSRAVRRMAQIEDRHVSFGLAGGEPTIHPNYKDILEEICLQFGQRLRRINTTTNLSLPTKFFDDIITRLGDACAKLNFVASYHLEHSSLERFTSNVKLLAGNKVPVSISVMAHPQKMETVKQLHRALQRIDADGVDVRIVPIRENFGVVLDRRYSQADIAWLQEFDRPKHDEGIILDWNHDGQIRRLSLTSATDLSTLGLNRFKGMYCNAGVNHLSIDETGQVAPAVCFRSHPHSNSNIYQAGYRFQPQPVICPFERCGCQTDLRMPKYHSGWEDLSSNPLAVKNAESTRNGRQPSANKPLHGIPSADDIARQYAELIESSRRLSPIEVISRLNAFIDANPQFAAAHNDLAVVYLNNGNHAAAGEHYRQAIAHEPENATFVKNYADYVYFIEKDPDAATEIYTQLQRRNPGDTEVLFGLGRIHQDRGNLSKARDFLNQVLALDPKHKDARTTLAQILTEDRDAGHSPGDRKAEPLSDPEAILTTRLERYQWTRKRNVYKPYLDKVEYTSNVADPSISVICISWRHDPDTLISLQSLQAERHLNYELIFVDNGGQPGEFDPLKEYVDTYIRLNRNSGAYLARNVGALFANAPIILFLEDDGLPAPGFIAAHLEAFNHYDVISVRGVYRPKTPGHYLNSLAPHYYLGTKPFPHFVNLEGNASYDAHAFFAVGGWDDEIQFGHGGPELAYRLFDYTPVHGKQIYSPAPVLYHDFADNDQHLQRKFDKQGQSMHRLVAKHHGFEEFLSSWSDFYGQTGIIKSRHGEPEPLSQPDGIVQRKALDANSPVVSIVIPTYNRSQFLAEALASTLAQTHPAQEIIVVDDASTDDTAAVVAQFENDRIRYIRKNHSGAPDTRNRGIREARGDYILWLDDDDILMPDALESHMDVWQSHPEADVIYGVLQEFDSATGDNLKLFDPKDWSEFPEMLSAAMLSGCPLPNPGTMVRRSVYETVGLYDTTFTRAHDYEFWSRALNRLQYKKNYSIVCRYRVHDANMSTGGYLDRSFESQIVRNMLARENYEQIYHWLNWQEAEAAHTVALYMASENLLKVGDPQNALALLDQIPSHLQTVDIQTLKVRGLINQGKSQSALDLLASLQGSHAMTSGQLKALNTIVLEFHDQTRRLKKAIRRSDRKQIRRYLQTLEDNGQDVTPDQILALIALDPNAVSDRQKLRMLQTAVMLDPENSVLMNRAEHMLLSEDDRQELAATCRRVLSQPDRNENLKRPSTKSSSTSNRSVDISAGTSSKAAASVSIIMPYFGTQTALTQIISQLAANPDVSYEFFLITADRFRKKTPAWFKTSVGANITLTPLPVISGNQPTTTDFNQALKQTNGRYIVLLQQPMRIGSRWLQATRSLDKQGQGWGLASPVVCGSAGLLAPPDFLTTGSFANRSATLFAQRPHRRFFPTGISSPCTIISRHLWHTMGSLRPGIKNPLTAVSDYSLRANQGGYRNVIFGDILAEDFQIRPSHKRRRQRNRTRKPFPSYAKALPADASTENGIGNDQRTYRDTIEGIANAFHNDQLDVAVNIYQAAATQFSQMPNLKEWMAEHLVVRGQARAALEVLGDIAPSTAGPDQMALYASALENNGQYEQAAEWTERLLAQHPDHAVGLDLRGVLAFRQGDHTKAEACFTAAIESDPSAYRAYNHLATLIWSKGDETEALRHFRQAFIINPADPSIAADLHTAALAQDDMRATYRLFAEAHQYFPENRQLLFLLINFLLKLEEYQKAMDLIEAAIVRFGPQDGLLDAALSNRDRIGPYSGHGAHPEDRVSLCMIAKDEAAHLARCLHSLKPVVDEIILVDTGSNDATRKIAAIFGARVLEFEWCDDFAAARNYAIDHAGGNWILIIDADEVISSRDYAALQALIRKHRSNSVAFSIVTRNYTRQCNLIGWQANDGTYALEEAGTGWTPSEKVRLFPNDPRLRFEFPVHEVVRPALERSKFRIKPSKIPVHHYGYLDHEKAACKGESYYRIGLQKLQQMAHDPQALRELAVQAALLGHHDESVDLWHKFLEIEPDNARAYVNISTAYGQLGRYQDARDAAYKASKLDKNLKEAFFNAAMAELYLGKAAKAASLLKPLVLKYPQYFAAVFMLGCARICCEDIPEGLAAISRLESTPVWKTIRISIEEIVQGLAKAGRQNDAERIRTAMDSLDLPGSSLSRSPNPEQTASCAAGL